MGMCLPRRFMLPFTVSVCLLENCLMRFGVSQNLLPTVKNMAPSSI